MELLSDEVHKIKGLLEEWQTHPEIELEASFGFQGQVDVQTFLRVITRLKSKGYSAISQQDRLTITLPDQIRYTLTGSGQVSQYCRDNRISDKPFIAIIKDRNISEEKDKSSNIDIHEYDVRVKARREIELSNDDPRVQQNLQRWEGSRKFFRLIRRWTFEIPGLKFDLSMVRSTKRHSWQRNFQDQNIIGSDPTYEIETELDRATIGDKDAFKTLINGMGDILRGIQGNTILTRKSTKENVLLSYKELTNVISFRGVQPKTLEYVNMSSETSDEPNIRFGSYNVTDKADGLRVLGYTNESGELFMIDGNLNVYRTGLAKETCKNSLLDGEYITRDKYGKPLNLLLFFDIYYHDKQNVSNKIFKGERYDEMQDWYQAWIKDGGPKKILKTASLDVGVKEFMFSSNEKSIFSQAEIVLKKDPLRVYHTDGLIFTPNDMPLPQEPDVSFDYQFKWKPSEENTIDFLAVTQKDSESTGEDSITTGIHPITQQSVRYKTLHLYVGSSVRGDGEAIDPRAIILYNLPLPSSYIGETKGQKYRPVPFIPKDYADPFAATCYVETFIDPKTNEEYISTEGTNEIIRDKSIVEMAYDPTQPPGWRWIPKRVRADKTEKFLIASKGRGKFSRTLNSDKTAQSVWNSIHNPVTYFMITTGSDVPSPEERAKEQIVERGPIKKYFDRKATAADLLKVKGLQSFHGDYIKYNILYESIAKHTPSPKLLDLAVGRGNDLHKWVRMKAGFILGVDATEGCCKDPQDSGYSRLVQKIESSKTMRNPFPIPPMYFVVADSSLRLVDGSAGQDDEEADILRSLFGRVAPIKPVPPAIEQEHSPLKSGADALTLMYALHYFFETPDKLNGLLQNIADNLRIGGYFVGTNFDGQSVFDFLRGVEKDKSRVGMEGETILWEITKLYDAEELPLDDNAFGMAIDVNFISIGVTHREYLVPWPLFVAKMKSIGCELVDASELKQLGLQNSTNMYEESYDMAMKSRDKLKYKMNEASKQYSFLNRWYIFKRTSDGSGNVAVQVERTERTENTSIAEILSQNTFKAENVFQFSEKSPKVIKHLELPAKIKEYAGRYLSPNAPFRIKDDTGIEYPSITHFLAAMKLKLASAKPEMANIFSMKGEIHQQFLGSRLALSKSKAGKPLTQDEENDILEKETEKVLTDSMTFLRTPSVGFNESKWNVVKDSILEKALLQRLQADTRFCTIVSSAISQRKYLLYLNPSELGGSRAVGKGTIQGENKYGKMILKLAAEHPDELRACLST